MFAHRTHLTPAMSFCSDKERNNMHKSDLLRRTFAYARGIDPVVFGKVTHGPVELRQPPAATLYRQASGL